MASTHIHTGSINSMVYGVANNNNEADMKTCEGCKYLIGRHCKQHYRWENI